MLSSKSPLGMFHDFFWISCSILFVSILCVHVSLWINIFVMLSTLETYTHERWYISSWYRSSLESTVLFFLIFCGSRKNLPMSACLILLHLHALIFGLVTSFAFPLHLIELVNPYALCGIFVSCVLGWHVKHYVPYISKTMLMLNAHPCISLTKGLTMSLTQFWLSQFLCLIFSYRSTICLLQVLCFISYLCSLARFWCLKWF